MTSIEVVDPAGADLGECPVWSPDEQALHWVDIEGRRIHRYEPSTGSTAIQEVAGRPGAIARTDHPGRWLIALETSLAWFDWSSGKTTPWIALEQGDSGNRMNDGRTDPSGRFWVGSMFPQPAANRFTGNLYRVTAGGTTSTIRTNVGVSNGLAFDPQRRRMYWADTLHDMVWHFDYDDETGEVRNETPFIDFSGLPGRPDGACVDSEGCYWIAGVYGWAVMRFTPEGQLDRTIELPVEAPTMPAFGGPDLTTLFITSIGAGGSRPPAPGQPHAGSLLAVETNVAGIVDPPFATSQSGTGS